MKLTAGKLHARIAVRAGMRLMPALLCAAALHPAALHAQTLAWGEAWGNVFADRDVTQHLGIDAQQSMRGRVSWQLTVNRAVIQRGEAAVTVESGRTAEVAIPLRIPPVNPGVVMDAELAVAFAGEDGADSSLQKPLTVFHENAFANRSVQLEALNIALFDPAETTAARLEKAGVPFRTVRNIDSIPELDSRLVVVGEAVSLESRRGLFAVLQDTARSGTSVLCLAPADGAFALPGAEAHDGPRPASVALRRNDVIHELDKRLDAASWPPDGRVTACAMSVRADRGGVVGAVVPDGNEGWLWVEIVYPGGGRLIVSGFAVMAHWEATPAPRYLFVHMIDRLTGPDNKEE